MTRSQSYQIIISCAFGSSARCSQFPYDFVFLTLVSLSARTSCKKPLDVMVIFEERPGGDTNFKNDVSVLIVPYLIKEYFGRRPRLTYLQTGNTSGAAQASHLCSLQSYGYSLCMRVTVGHLRVSDVTLCSTCCGCSSHPRKSLRAHVPLHHPFSSSKEYIGCLDASIKDENIHLP